MNSVITDLRATYTSGLTRPREWRLQQLQQLALMLEKHESELLQALESDLGKSAAEGWLTELGFLKSDIGYTSKQLKKWMRPRSVSQPLLAWPGRSQVYPEPLGVVLIIGAWNYPVQLLLSPLVAALAAGNCAVLKPSEHAPATADVLARLIPDYLSPEAVTVITGGADVAEQLLKQKFDHILYTGGGRVGRLVMKAAAEHLTPVTLELGGKSPAVVLSDADLKVSARRIAWGKWLNAGQTCIAPDYILVDEQVRSDFIDELKKAIESFFGEDAELAEDYGRIVNQDHCQRLISYLDHGTIAYGGNYDAELLYIEPTILTDVEADSPVMQEEIFGPVLPVLSVRNLAEAIQFIRDRDKPLALYGFSRSERSLKQLTEQTHAGNQCNNDTLMFMLNPELPFGGVGASGMGRYHGRYGFDTFSHQKAVMSRPFWMDPSFRYPPYTSFKQKLMRWFT
ncbi:aldehyde dehydrogenase [Pseudidiomarina salinarum]|uniref:Aldehyde dehydrogenase n=1 Tax=Pseudidiomarina salinarum TaxID=435908 RepID=A0A094L657_9GAMM|nr:aldehyde dehydrogenase family protein [Pseudidiomarina salinarum]KFZ30208.1 aldehyde dehydrogenase [Pseudidiomarina salinarum]RUO69907.1 aldehyde dehydrogenase family protein [Pseudidiomarina salinarum]